MDKYEYRAKTEQMLAYAEQKSYQKAMSIADTIDWRKVKNTAMLSTVSEIYENAGELGKARDTLFIAYDKAPSSRKVVYRLGIISLKLGHFDEAADCYEEFVKLAPKDPNQYIHELQTRSAKMYMSQTVLIFRIFQSQWPGHMLPNQKLSHSQKPGFEALPIFPQPFPVLPFQMP